MLVTKDAMLKEVVDGMTTTRCSFSMCNPPFFSSAEEKLGGSTPHCDRPAPSTFSSGTGGETVTEGGEVGFVRRMIEDSLELGERVRQAGAI